MTVFLLYEGSYDDRILLGAHATLDGAKARAADVTVAKSYLKPHRHDWERKHDVDTAFGWRGWWSPRPSR